MKTIAQVGLALATLSLVVLSALATPVRLPLQRVSSSFETPAFSRLGWDERLSGSAGVPGDRQALLRAIDYSVAYLQTATAAAAYRRYPDAAFTRDRVQRSLERFRQLVLTSRSPEMLQTAVQQEFEFYQSIGTDGRGSVSFTGYFEPSYAASRVPTPEFRYPIYRLPADFARWTRPHPTRSQLEGPDGLQAVQGKLKGSELVWLRDRLEAYLVQVQGSARLQLTDGSSLSVGVAGHTDYPYTSIGRELVASGKIRPEDLTLPAVVQYFQQHPEELSLYLPRNERFVFFQETAGAPATGSLGVPVTAERSIATDKSLMPPGALALIQTQLPDVAANGQLELRLASRYVLDQDTGGAIRGAGRVDLFTGSGPQAGERAGRINAPGQLYYLLLKQ